MCLRVFTFFVHRFYMMKFGLKTASPRGDKPKSSAMECRGAIGSGFGRGGTMQTGSTNLKKHILVNFGCSVILGAGLAAPVSAHHSFSGYDMSKTLSAPATLKEFRWGAPHSSVVFLIKGADGKPQEVSMASASPASFAKQGFKPRDFKVGDKMTITWHPSKSGAVGGTLATLKLPDGREFGDAEFGPGGPGAGPGSPDTQAQDAQFPPGTSGAN